MDNTEDRVHFWDFVVSNDKMPALMTASPRPTTDLKKFENSKLMRLLKSADCSTELDDADKLSQSLSKGEPNILFCVILRVSLIDEAYIKLRSALSLA